MKIKMIVTPALDNSPLSLTGAKTDMLVLARFEDGGDGPMQAFDELTNGKLSKLLTQRKFTGRLGQRFTYQHNGDLQRRLLVLGLGRGADFSCVTIARAVGVAVHKAVSHGCSQLSFQFLPNRFTNVMKLASQAQFIHEAATKKLEEYEGDSELTIELLCPKTGNAKRELEKGLALPLTGRICCRHVDGKKS